MKSRLKEKWGEQKRFGVWFSGNNPDFQIIQNKVFGTPKIGEKIELEILLDSCEEIIYSFENSIHVLHLVVRSFDTNTLEIIIESLWKLSSDDENSFKFLLSLILSKNIGIYGDNDIYQQTLDDLLTKVFQEGIIVEGKQYKLTKYDSFDVNDIKSLLKFLNSNERIYNFEVKLLNESISPKLKLASYLHDLEKIILELEAIINSKNRNENQIQTFLTANPVLLGTEYKRIVPKHKLGSEYEMDYALEKYNGIYDLLEIESSNLKLFTKQGNPTKELVHAEQQVLDWQQWIEEKNFYAQEKLKGILSPKGFIIIGRNESDEVKRKLKRRNVTFNGIQILTYDDLLEKARTLLKKIKTEE
jgi:hypothetical protein